MSQELQDKFVKVANEIEDLKKLTKEKYEQLDQLMNDLGVGAMFQSFEGLVYRIEVPKGTFMEYKQIGYSRTKRAEESKGSLSKKEAQASGFVVN